MTKSSPRALCLAQGIAKQRSLGRALRAAGARVVFADSAAAAGQQREPADLLVIDAADGCAEGVDSRFQLLSEDGYVVMLGRSLDDDSMIELMRDHLDHAISDAGADHDDLIVTAAKLISGDIFGVEKYLSWGANVHDLEIRSYEEKRIALLTATAFAKRAGARRPVVARIECVADELLMNAMYNAPALSRGIEPDPFEAASSLSRDREEEGVRFRYATDGRHFALSVEDRFGVLRKETIIDNLARARTQRAPRDEPTGGAGLGLYFVFSSATRFIANIEDGKRTEIICLFDLRQGGRNLAACASSLHVFRGNGHAAPGEPDSEPPEDEPDSD